MSGGRIRLPLSGARGEAPVAHERDPRPWPVRAICVVDANGSVSVETSMLEASQDFARELGVEVRRIRAVARSRPGSELVDESDERVLRAGPDVLGSEVSAMIDGLAAEPGVLALGGGAPLVGLRQPDVAILIARSENVLGWSVEVRAIRERFDLIVSEPRPALAREIVRLLLEAPPPVIAPTAGAP